MGTQMMNAMKFMFFLALVVFVSATPVNEDDIVPETKLVDAGSASGSGSGSGTSSSTKTAGSSSKTAGSSSTTKSGRNAKRAKKWSGGQKSINPLRRLETIWPSKIGPSAHAKLTAQQILVARSAATERSTSTTFQKLHIRSLSCAIAAQHSRLLSCHCLALLWCSSPTSGPRSE